MEDDFFEDTTTDEEIALLLMGVLQLMEIQ